MKKLIIMVSFISVSAFAQTMTNDTISLVTKPFVLNQKTDTIVNEVYQEPIIQSNFDNSKSFPSKKPNTDQFYADYDLQQISNLLRDAKFNSSLIDSTNYVIKDSRNISNVDYIVDTDVLKSRLAEINATTPFHMEYNPSLEKVINNYVKYRRKYYPELMARAKYYFPLFEQYLVAYDIPLEMKYLAIVESALHPRIKSRVGATGIWQFMYGTGKQFKLDINSYIDERQDPVKSTIAACEYLKMLHEMFDDWDLALAAYNSGPGNVLKAIKRSGGLKNYWNLRPYLPYETAGYVPAFYATMYIFKYADDLDLKPKKTDIYYFDTDTIQVKRGISFKNITEKIGVDNQTLEFLNPKYKINYIPYTNKKQFSVRLPRNKVLEFIEKEQEIYALASYDESKREKPMAKYVAVNSGGGKGNRIRYKVRSGDYLGKIARKYGVKVKQIKRWNNMRGTKLSIGQRLYIYPRRM